MAKRKYTKRNVEPSFTISELEQYGFGDFLKQSGKYVKDLARSGADLMLTSTLIPGANKVIKKSDYETNLGRNFNPTNAVGDTQTAFWDSSLNSFGATNAITPDAYETNIGRKAGESSDKHGLLGGKAAAGILGTWFGGPAGGAAAVGGIDKVQNAVGSKYGAAKTEADEAMLQQQSSKQYQEALGRFNPKVSSNVPVFGCGGKLKKYPGGGTLEDMANTPTTGKGINAPMAEKYLTGREDSMLGALQAEAYRRANEGTWKGSKNYWTDLGKFMATIPKGDLRGQQEYDNLINTYPNVADAATKYGYAPNKNRGFSLNPPIMSNDSIITSTQYPDRYKQLTTKKTNGGYVMEYGGASHDGGGIPVDGTTGNPTAIMGGKPNAEVENKEVGVKFPGEETPFIFSDKLGYAKQAKKIQNKYSKRPNDSISQDAMYMELGGLMQEQEAFKAKKIQYHQNKLKQFGGPILGDNIVGNEDYSYRKGGNLPTYGGSNKSNDYRNFLKTPGDIRAFQSQYGLDADSIYGPNTAAAWDKYGSEYSTNMGYNPESIEGSVQGTTKAPVTMRDAKKFSETSGGDYSSYGGSAMPMIATAAGNLAMMLGNKKPATYQPTQITPEQISLEDNRRDIRENTTGAKANRLRYLREAGLSPSQYGSLVAASDIGLNRESNQALRSSYLQEQIQNAAARGDVTKFNALQAEEASKTNLSLQDQYKRQQAEYLKSALETVPEYFGQRERYDTLNATSPNYDIVTDPKSKWYNRRPKFVPKTR